MVDAFEAIDGASCPEFNGHVGGINHADPHGRHETN